MASERKQKITDHIESCSPILNRVTYFKQVRKNTHTIRIQAISLLFLSTLKTAVFPKNTGCTRKTCDAVFSEGFVWNIFSSGRYLDSYKTDACRKLCGSSHKLSVSAVRFSGDWNVSIDIRKTAKYKIIQYWMKLKNIIELLQIVNNISTQLQQYLTQRTLTP
jgi:hypothetical protein